MTRLLQICSLVAAIACLASTAFAQPVTCNAAIANQQLLRQEGKTEPASDIFLSCTGTFSGGTATVTLNANTAITSRQLGPNVQNLGFPTEAGLLANDCTTNTGVSTTGASCSPSGTFHGGNPIQGFLNINNSLVFSGVSFPSNGQPFKLRITNIRLDATQLAAGASALGTVSTTSAINLQNGSNLVLGTVRPSLSVTVSNPITNFDQCQPHTTTLTNFTLAELFNNAFRSPATSSDNNTPGAWYQTGSNTESQFAFQNYVQAEWNNSMSGVIPGQADYATRIHVSINAPPGVTITMPPSVNSDGTGVITATQGGDTGPFSAIGGTGIVINGSGSVTYEVTKQSSTTIESFNFPITISYTGNPSAGQITVSAYYVPTAAEAAAAIPLFGGSSTTPATLATIAPCMTLTSLTPNTAQAGGPSFSLVLQGTGFTSATVVTWNGTPLSSNFFDQANITATVPATLISAAGTAQVAVSEAGRIAPPALPFSITPGLTLTSLSPVSTLAGGPQFTLTLNGTGFNSQSQAFWNTVPLTTAFVSANQLNATVPATLIAQPTSVTITAQTSSAISNGLPFAVTSTQFSLSSLLPPSAVAGGPQFTLTLNGAGFNTQTQALWNTIPLSTTFVTANQLTAQVPANLIAAVGTAQVVAQNGSVLSNALAFNIVAQLTLSSISPNTTAAGGPTFTLTANGTGFTQSTAVVFNGTALSTTFLSSQQLTAQVPASLIAAPANVQVTVQNGTQASNAQPFTITSNLTLINISPNSANAGDPTFTLTGNGTGFNTGTVLVFNGTALGTTFVNSQQITAQVPATLIANAGTVQVTAANGSQNSNALPFTINASLTLTSLSPSATTAGSAQFTLTINGTGFNSGTTFFWNAVALTATPVSAVQATATVPANLVAQPGSALVTAHNGNLSSNSLPFTITPGLTLTSLSPGSAIAGSGGFTLNVSGTGFNSGTTILWNGSAIPSSFVSVNQMTASVSASLIATTGSATVTAQNGTQVSNGLTFSITNPPVTLISLSPNTAPAGSPQLTMFVNGSGFLPPSGTSVTWNGTPLATQVLSRNQLSATVPASLLASPGVASVSVSGGSTPSSLPFTITSSLSLTSISPSTVAAGGPAFTLTANGSGFINGSLITFNGTALATSFVSSGQLTTTVPANLILTPGTASIDVTVPGQPSPPALQLVIAPALTLTSLNPTSAIVGGPQFTLTVNGTGFASGAVVNFGTTPLITTFINTTQLTAIVPSNLIAKPDSVPVTAAVAGVVSNSIAFNILPPSPVITSLSPSTATSGGPAFTLTINGTGFISTSSATWNGQGLQTTFVSTTQLTAAVSADLIAKPGTASVVVFNGAGNPNLASNAATFTITPPVPTITSISPSTVTVGGPAFTLNVTGTNFLTGAVVSLGSTALSTTFVSATQVTAAVPASAIAQAGTVQVTLTNPIGPASNAVPLTIKLPVPTITSISPSSAIAGGPAFSLSVTGTNFFAGATVLWNGASLNTSFISGTQLTAAVTADLISKVGTASVTATNAGTDPSNSVVFTIKPPTPTITSINPTSVPPGGPFFVLTVNGTNFLSGAVASAGTTALATTFVSATQLRAAVPASLTAQAGTLAITVANAGGTASNAVNLTITGAPPTLSSLSPATVTQGGPAFTLTINGTNFVSGATASLGPNTLATTFVSSTQVTAAVPANLIQQPGPQPVTVTNPGSVPSNPLPLTVAPPGPTLTSIVPASAKVGDPTFTLSVTGTGFVQASIVQWDGAPLSTTFVSSTQLTATIAAGRLILPATASVTVVNPGPLVSNALTFTINPVLPAISTISPDSAFAGDPAFSLTVNGTGFLTLTTIQFNNTALTTHFVSDTQVTADVPATVLTQVGTASITAVNPGNNVSNAVTFTINTNLPAVLSSLSKTTATAGDAAFSLTINGTGFRNGAVANFGTTALTTSFVSATQLTATIPASVLLTPGIFQIAVQQAGTTSNALSFVVNLPAAPSLRLNPPANPGPNQQPTIDFGLNSPYPIPLAGTLTLTFAPNATVPSDDPMIQFATGGRTFAFTVPANTTTLPAIQISTGTVAGTITISVTLTAAGVNVTPSSGTTATIVIPKSAPVILPGKIKIVHANGYLEVDVTAFSTTRDMTQAVFHLNAAPGGSFTSTDITVPLSPLFTTWYQSAASTAFGSQFTYVQQFTVIGDTNQVQSVTVTLTNSAGASAPMTSN